MKAVVLVALIAGCDASHPDDVVGPYTGTTHRFAVDSFTFPLTSAHARELGADLDGNGEVDNSLGWSIAFMRGYGNITDHGFDMLAAGTIVSSLEIVADDLWNDDTVLVRYLGADGAPSVGVGGKMVDGVFRSNRTRDSNVTGAAELYLPVFVDAAPSVMPLIGMELDLDPDGAGGYAASIRGGVPADAAFDAAADGIVELVASDPGAHLIMFDLFDLAPRDRVVSRNELDGHDLLESLLFSDLEIAGTEVLSFGFTVHVRPCESGNCLGAEPFDRCFDRVLDGDETAIDCGGSCRGCEAGAQCVAATDCETTICDAGRCGPPSCENGARDGFETDVDCGSGCSGCASGASCVNNSDCESGECGPPPPACENTEWFPCAGDRPAYATCE